MKMKKYIIFSVIIIVLVLVSIKNNETYSEYKSESILKERNYVSKLDSMYLDLDSITSAYSNLKRLYELKDSNYSAKSSKTLIQIKTEYKDSIRTVYIEKSDYEENLTMSIKKLEDSITVLKENEKKLTQIVKHDTIYLAQKEDTKTGIKSKDTRYTVYADGTMVLDEKLNLAKIIDFGIDYRVLGPVFIGANVNKSGFDLKNGYLFGVRAGIKFQF
jgi:hypothetical protein